MIQSMLEYDGDSDDNFENNYRRHRQGVKRKLNDTKVMNTVKLKPRIVDTKHPYLLYKFYDRQTDLLILKNEHCFENMIMY